MRLVTFVGGHERRLGVVLGDQVVDVTLAYAALLARRGRPRASAMAEALVPPNLVVLLRGGEPSMEALREAVAFAEQGLKAGGLAGIHGERTSYRMADVRIKAPLQDPRKIVCIGLNYADHAAEGGREIPKTPVTFGKWSDAIIGPGDPIVIPKTSPMIDYEGELAFIMGRRAKYVKEEEAFDYVAGYTIFHDVSAREFQRADPQTMRGKALEGFAPMGPALVLKDEVPDPQALDIETRLNGQVMQQSNTRHFIFTIPFLIAFITRSLTLEPGDVVATGTPAGVGFARTPPVWLKPGDVVQITIERLGTLENPVIAEA